MHMRIPRPIAAKHAHTIMSLHIAHWFHWRPQLVVVETSGRFIKQEQWERWRAKWKLVSGSKHRGRLCMGSWGISPGNEIVYAKSYNLVHFWPENGSQCCPYAFLNT